MTSDEQFESSISGNQCGGFEKCILLEINQRELMSDTQRDTVCRGSGHLRAVYLQRSISSYASKKWFDVIGDEMKSHENNHTWVLVTIPHERKVAT